MEDQFPPSDRCDFCKRKATTQSDDKADLCKKCFKESVVYCCDCQATMVWTVSIYRGYDDKTRCGLCDQDYTESLTHKNIIYHA